MLSPEAWLFLQPETRCAMYGHVLIEHELLGMVCGRCGGFEPSWVLCPDGAHRPPRDEATR